MGALGKYYYGWRRQQILHPSREVEQQQPWLDEYIVIECWNWQANGRHELIGVSSVLCMRDFLTCTRYQFTLINKEKKERCVPAPTCVGVAMYAFAHIYAEASSTREVPVLSDFAKEFTGMSVRVPYRHSGILYVEAIEVRSYQCPFHHQHNGAHSPLFLSLSRFRRFRRIWTSRSSSRRPSSWTCRPPSSTIGASPRPSAPLPVLFSPI